LNDVLLHDEDLVKKVFLLEDCTSPVVIPGADYTEPANEAFQKFSNAGMNLVRSTEPIMEWHGIDWILRQSEQ